jgi:hypothetical protein
MIRPSLSTGRVALVLLLAFAFGGGSAEVAVRTHKAIEKARADREVGGAGQLVALQLTDADGGVVARPRVIAPHGKRTELVLHDPLHPDDVRLAFRVEASREPSGFIALRYTLWVPDRAISASGRLSLTPGVEQAVAIGDGSLVATWMAVPVPSAAFDAYIESETARRVPVKAT